MSRVIILSRPQRSTRLKKKCPMVADLASDGLAEGVHYGRDICRRDTLGRQQPRHLPQNRPLSVRSSLVGRYSDNLQSRDSKNPSSRQPCNRLFISSAACMIHHKLSHTSQRDLFSSAESHVTYQRSSSSAIKNLAQSAKKSLVPDSCHTAYFSSSLR